MNPIQITLTGRLGDDPRTLPHPRRLRRRRAPHRSRGSRPQTASPSPAGSRSPRSASSRTRTAESVRKGDRVTVIADDMIAEAWAANGSGEPRARVTLRAREIAASMAFDSLRTGYADPQGRPRCRR